ncbi:ABC transporter permease [Symbioplanes lichenis]|uniref:ABC transporter permease n=1 Tax=Symbioplanes lichenis TaxID=1629072 RepID=UPI00273A446A|nr:ABC transporter permease subunit [Actinoplanes lichenis]
MSLFRAETRRLTKRRFTKFFLLGVLLILAAVAVGMGATNQKRGPETAAAAQAEARQEFEAAVERSKADKQACEAAQGTPDAGNWPSNCADMYEPQQADFDPQWYEPATFQFEESFPAMVVVLASLLAAAAFVIGASYVGAEWNSGGMMNLLLWRPKRVQVLGTKLLALLSVFTVLTVVLSALWTGVFALIGEFRGSMEGMTAGAWQSVALTELRGLVIVLVAGAVGFGLASIGRHTAVAMGAAIGVIAVLQVGLATVLSLAGTKFVDAYLAPAWLSAWMLKEVKLEDWNACNFSPTGCEPDTLTLTWPMAGGLLGGILVLIVALALWSIRSRDIT